MTVTAAQHAFRKKADELIGAWIEFIKATAALEAAEGRLALAMKARQEADGRHEGAAKAVRLAMKTEDQIMGVVRGLGETDPLRALTKVLTEHHSAQAELMQDWAAADAQRAHDEVEAARRAAVAADERKTEAMNALISAVTAYQEAQAALQVA